MNEAIRVAMVSLGCARNLVDSEVLLGHAVEEGLQVVRDPEDADVVVVNTCGFIDSAKQESIDTILSVARLKKEGNLKGVIAVGCLAQRYGEELKQSIPELDAVFGISDYSGVPAVVRKIVNGTTRRFVATVDGGKPKVRAPTRSGCCSRRRVSPTCGSAKAVITSARSARSLRCAAATAASRWTCWSRRRRFCLPLA